MNFHEHRIRLKKLKGGKYGFVKCLFYNFGNWINALFSAQINICGHLSKRKY